MLNTYVVEMPTDRPGDIAEAYAEVDAVEMAIPDRQATMIAFEPNDPFWASENSWEQGYADLWGMKMIGAYDAWQAVRGSGVRIAVIDDSIERFHVDIQPNLCINEDDPPDYVDNDGNGYADDYFCGYNFVGKDLGTVDCSPVWEDADPLGDVCDSSGHGSHVGGTLGAASNFVGVIGVAPEATLMPLKIFGALGANTTSAAANAILYAVAEGADVANLSWVCSGGCGLELVFAVAYRLGLSMVAASGNDGLDVPNDYQPQSLDEVVILVGAHDRLGNVTDFSNFGPELDVVAPGGGSSNSCSCGVAGSQPCTDTMRNILSARSYKVHPQDTPGCAINNQLVPFGGDWHLNVGTSMAAPHVAGTAALLLDRFPWMTPADLRWVIKRSAKDVVSSGQGVDDFTGYGRLQTGRAVRGTQAVRAIEDAWVTDGNPNANHGFDDRLKVKSSGPKRISYVKFDVTELPSHQGAALRLCRRDGNVPIASGGKVYTVDPAAWTEGTVTWNNRPSLGAEVGPVLDGALGNLPEEACVPVDVTSYVNPGGLVSFAIVKQAGASEIVSYDSTDGAADSDAPHLVVAPCGGCAPCNGVDVMTAMAETLPSIIVAVSVLAWPRKRRCK
jgi:serine protease